MGFPKDMRLKKRKNMSLRKAKVVEPMLERSAGLVVQNFYNVPLFGV